MLCVRSAEEYKVAVAREVLWLHRRSCLFETLCKPPGLARPSITPTNNNARISAYRRTRKRDIYTAQQSHFAHPDKGNIYITYRQDLKSAFSKCRRHA
jgi:hypothetical protein